MSDEMLKKAKDGQRKTKKKLEEERKKRPKTNLSHLKSSDPVSFNTWSEGQFVELVLGMIDESESGKVPWAQVRKDAAYEIGISLETAKRYIEKYTARKAPFRHFDGQIFLNPRYESKQEPTDPADAEPLPAEPPTEDDGE